jgi:hypothetical protein
MERGAKKGYAELRGRAPKDTQAALKRNRSLRGLAATITVGGAVAAVMFLPGVSVEPEGPIDPADPHPISFRIMDANFIPLNNVNAYLEICYVAAAPAPVTLPCQPPYETRLFKAGWRDHTLTTNQEFSITLDDYMRLAAPAKFGGAEISIIVEYQPLNLPIRQEKEFRFGTESGANGKFYWIARPLDEQR